ncbi:response regulator [Methylobacterium sp. E-016]|uniref:response regulator n=1 Tax=Methylobacterium sp. E-016 TaxID=2836556 RepID=UPI001FB970AF|nr:response regulator [Methylobacterium sp. E-016]MCJ2077102.1 response regulator [Methylobacterium sp. E-016]
MADNDIQREPLDHGVAGDTSASGNAGGSLLESARAQLIESIATSTDGFALFDADEQLVYCNDQFHRFHPGLADLVVRGVIYADLARAAGARCVVRDGTTTIEEWLEERLIHFRGSAKPILQQQADGRWTRITESRTEDGGTVAVYTDVTEIKVTEQTLLTTQGRLNYLLTASPSMICSFEVGGQNVPTFISENVRELLGYEPSDYLAGPEFWLDRLHADDRDRVLAQFPYLLETGHNVIEYRFLRKDGTYCWVRDEQRLVRDSRGEPIEVVESWSDITERKEAELALREQSAFVELLQATATAANDALTVEDAVQFCLERVSHHTGWPLGHAYLIAEDGALQPTGIWHGDGPLPFAGFRAVTGATRFLPGVGLPGRAAASAEPSWALAPAPADCPRAAAAEADGIRAGFAFPVTIGREVVMVLEFFSTEAVAPKSGLLKVMVNIGAQLGRVVERQRAEANLRHAKESAENASRAKSSFLANMSHELRTPLNAIIGFTRLVMRRAKDVLPLKQFENLEKILTSSEHLLSLINSILDLAKVEAGRMEVKVTDFALESTLDLCLRTVEPLLKSDRVRLVRDVEDVPETVRTDQEKLKQILINLLSNAVKFTEAGSVTLRVRTVDKRIVFTVTDTGIGIPDSALNLIFEEFQQVDNSASRSHGGTGLGLAISCRLARMLGGDIAVESREGEGSTFILTLPQRLDGLPNPQAVLPTGAAAEVPVRTGSSMVLAIDDDPNVVYLLKENLSDAGYEVVGASNGEDGLRLARELRPRAITLDIMMPGADGWQVLHALKTDPQTREIPVILLSIVDQKELGYRLGANDYIVKPFERESLIGALARIAPNGEHILVIDDDPNVVDLVRQLLDTERCTIDWVPDGVAGLERIAHAPPSVILLDLLMPRMDGITFLDHLQADPVGRTIPVIILTAATLESAERAMLQERVLGLIDKRGLDRNAILRQVKRVLPLMGSPAGQHAP